MAEIAASLSGNSLVTVPMSGLGVHIFDLPTFSSTFVNLDATDRVCCAALSADGTRFVVGRFDGDVQVFDLKSRFSLQRSVAVDYARCVAFHPSGSVYTWAAG